MNNQFRVPRGLLSIDDCRESCIPSSHSERSLSKTEGKLCQVITERCYRARGSEGAPEPKPLCEQPLHRVFHCQRANLHNETVQHDLQRIKAMIGFLLFFPLLEEIKSV